jgi:Disulphide bond corrector protein DsbC
MPLRRITTISLLCAFLSPLGARDPGPPVGSPFPESGLKSTLGPKGALILVDESAPPGAAEIQRNREAVQKLGLGIAAVSSKIHPGWYVLDARGVIVSKYLDDHARYTPAAILVHQFGWTPPEPAVEVQGKQLAAKAGASDATVSPGERITLILDIDLNPNMHVYAPGVDGYIPIDWKMQDSETAAVQPAMFPRSQKLYLKAIGETVPTYRGHFRLTRDVTIPPQDQFRPAPDASGRVLLPGSLRYQACDDRVCYIPQELHLAWAFQFSTPLGSN